MSPEAPEAAVTSRQWLRAGSDTKGPSCHLVLPATQGQQSLAVVARGVLLQEGESCQRISPGEAWFKVLGTGKASSMSWTPCRYPCSSGRCQHILSTARAANTGAAGGRFPLPR